MILAEWFEDNYLGRLTKRGTTRRRPLFPPAIWNLYLRTLNGENRTNHYAEATNRKLQVELEWSTLLFKSSLIHFIKSKKVGIHF